MYAFAEQEAEGIAGLRHVTGTRMDASPFAADEVQRDWLRAAATRTSAPTCR